MQSVKPAICSSDQKNASSEEFEVNKHMIIHRIFAMLTCASTFLFLLNFLKALMGLGKNITYVQ